MTTAALVIIRLKAGFLSATAWTNSGCSSPNLKNLKIKSLNLYSKKIYIGIWISFYYQYRRNLTVHWSRSLSVMLHKNPNKLGAVAIRYELTVPKEKNQYIQKVDFFWSNILTTKLFFYTLTDYYSLVV